MCEWYQCDRCFRNGSSSMGLSCECPISDEEHEKRKAEDDQQFTSWLFRRAQYIRYVQLLPTSEPLLPRDPAFGFKRFWQVLTTNWRWLPEAKKIERKSVRSRELHGHLAWRYDLGKTITNKSDVSFG